MKKLILSACFGFVLATGIYFFTPPAQQAEAQSSKWGNAAYSSCIMDNLKNMQTDRAINILVEYCSSRN